MFGAGPAHAQSAIAPFYTETTIYVIDKDQTLVAQSKVIMARKADGTTVHIRSVVPRELTTLVRELEFMDGNKITLYDSIKMKSTWPKDEGADNKSVVDALSPHSYCDVHGASVRLGDSMILGQTTNMVQQMIAGRYRVTQWLAPALGCEVLYYESELINSDGSFTLTAKGTTTVLKTGEPDSSLLDVGSTYAETKPSDANTRPLEQMHVSLSSSAAPTVQKENTQADWRYYSGDPNKARWGGVLPAK